MVFIVEQDQTQSKDSSPGQKQQVPWWRVVLSVMQAAFGVQSSRNRERDFTHGKLLHYIIAALIFTSLFVVLLLVIVNRVLAG